MTILEFRCTTCGDVLPLRPGAAPAWMLPADPTSGVKRHVGITWTHDRCGGYFLPVPTAEPEHPLAGSGEPGAGPAEAGPDPQRAGPDL